MGRTINRGHDIHQWWIAITLAWFFSFVIIFYSLWFCWNIRKLTVLATVGPNKAWAGMVRRYGLLHQFIPLSKTFCAVDILKYDPRKIEEEARNRKIWAPAQICCFFQFQLRSDFNLDETMKCVEINVFVELMVFNLNWHNFLQYF